MDYLHRIELQYLPFLHRNQDHIDQHCRTRTQIPDCTPITDQCKMCKILKKCTINSVSLWVRKYNKQMETLWYKINRILHYIKFQNGKFEIFGIHDLKNYTIVVVKFLTVCSNSICRTPMHQWYSYSTLHVKKRQKVWGGYKHAFKE